MDEFSAAEKFNEVTRLLAARIRHFPAMIDEGILTHKESEKWIAIMHAIATDYAERMKAERTTILSGG